VRTVFLLAPLLVLPIVTGAASATEVLTAAAPVPAGLTIFRNTFGSGDVLFKLTQGGRYAVDSDENGARVNTKSKQLRARHSTLTFARAGEV